MIPNNPKVGQVFDLLVCERSSPCNLRLLLPAVKEKLPVIISEVKDDELVVLGLDGKVRRINRGRHS